MHPCYHSTDTKNRMLSEVIDSLEGNTSNPCYLRRLSYRTATFDK